jgi:hypothetical protein
MDGVRMAKCKLCKTEIPDGNEYCKACLDKNSSRANESYLDSLLNSVINTVPSGANSYKKNETSITTVHNARNPKKAENEESYENKQNTNKIEDTANKTKKKSIKNDLNDFDLDIKDFSNYNINDDLEDNIIISDKELFGNDLDDIFSSNHESDYGLNYEPNIELNTESDTEPLKQFNGTKEEPEYKFNENYNEEEHKEYNEARKEDNDQNIIREDNLTSILKDVPEEIQEVEPKDSKKDYETDESEVNLKVQSQEILHDELPEVSKDVTKVDEADNVINEGIYSQTSDRLPEIANSSEDKEDNPDFVTDNYNPDEIAGLTEEDSLDSSLQDLLNNQDISEISINGEEKTNPEEEKQPLQDILEQPNIDDLDDKNEESDDDIINLLNQISADDPVADDVQAISDLLNGASNQKQENNNIPSDVGEVFSDALKVVSTLKDHDIGAHAPKELSFEEDAPENIKKSKKNSNKKEKIKKVKKKDKKNNKEENPQNEGENAPKKGLMKRLFGNVEEDSKKKKKPTVNNSIEDESAPAVKKSKKDKKKKDKKDQTNGQDKDESADSRSGKEEKDSKDTKKKEKKEKKKKDKEIIQVIDEIDEDDGRINRVGASIVFIFFGIMVMFLLIGTNIFSYSLSIKNATKDFERRKYTEAYNEVYGEDIKDEDIEIYDKIMTVMFVNKQLNSYNNYYAMKKYPEALDSLLKGLKRYDKYLELATMLGIKQDLDYVRELILAELNNVYDISEKEALQIINSDNQTDYSLQVYNAVLEKMNN